MCVYVRTQLYTIVHTIYSFAPDFMYLQCIDNV